MNQKPIASAHQRTFWQATILNVALLFSALPGRAQFTGDNQTNIIDGTAVNWSSGYYVGSNYVADALFILNGGSLTNVTSYVGYQQSGISNLAVVSGNGSAWTSGPVFVGYYGSANRLVVSDGGKVQTTYGGSVGVYGSNNTAIVTGSGSMFRLQQDFNVGVQDTAVNNSLVISNGGTLFTASTFRMSGASNNVALVTGFGSVFTNNLSFLQSVWNTLMVSNSGAMFNGGGIVIGRNNHILVTGSGSFWNSGSLYVGHLSPGANNRLTIADGGSVLASNIYVDFYLNASNCLINVSGGNLAVTNMLGTGLLEIRRGKLTLDEGTLRADQLRLTNGINSILEFNSGTLHSKSTLVSNTQPCVVGDGVASANFHLLGGVHSFQSGLRIRTNSFLTGCGTVNGSVVVDAGGAVHANCANLVFNSAVTNNGTMVVDGAVMETFGTFVNNGKLFLLHGGTTNFHSTFINNGVILNGDIHLTIERDGSGGLFIRYTGTPDVTDRLQRAASVTGPWSDLATNTAPASGLSEYHETSPPPGPAFYRTVQP